MPPIDPLITVEVLAATPSPQTVIYAAMHQDYSEQYVWEERDRFPTETKSGEIAVKRLLAGGRGHYGPLEHPQITFAVGYFPHCVIQQARTHRIASFDVQSARYSGQRFVDFHRTYKDQNKALRLQKLEELVYLRPVGTYKDRQGKTYDYTEALRNEDKELALQLSTHYARRLGKGFSEEQSRGVLPFDFRQHFVVSFNLRSLMHFLSVRSKADAQLEIRWLCDLIEPHFAEWCPEIYQWWAEHWKTKGRLAP